MSARRCFAIALFCSLAPLLIACASDSATERGDASSKAEPQLHAQRTEPAPQGAPAESGDVFAGEVLESFDSGGYTYLRVRTDAGEERWAAAENAAVATGDHVTLKTSVRMTNFEAKSLGRTFDAIWFVHIVGVDKAPETI